MTTAPASYEPPGDQAVWGILFTNVLVIAGAMVSDGGLLLLLWPYWFQSVVIGWYARRRILALRSFSTDGFKINDQEVADVVMHKAEHRMLQRARALA